MDRVKTADGLLSWLMRRVGFHGWTSFWRVIYVLPGHERDERLLQHERKHLEQIERDGRLLFSIKYMWWLARYGYWNNHYESRREPQKVIQSTCQKCDNSQQFD